MTSTKNIDEIVTMIEADLATATGHRRDSLTRRLNRLRNAPAPSDAAGPASEGNRGKTDDSPRQPLGDGIDQHGDATAQPETQPPCSPAATSDGHEASCADQASTAVPSVRSEPSAAQTAGAPAGTNRARMSVADKVLARAAHLATHPMSLDSASRFAPVARIQDGLFLSGDGKLLIARDGDNWQVSEFEVAGGELSVVGEVTPYPSAQQALVAIRLQMQAGVA